MSNMHVDCYKQCHCGDCTLCRFNAVLENSSGSLHPEIQTFRNNIQNLEEREHKYYLFEILRRTI